MKKLYFILLTVFFVSCLKDLDFEIDRDVFDPIYTSEKAWYELVDVTIDSSSIAFNPYLHITFEFEIIHEELLKKVNQFHIISRWTGTEAEKKRTVTWSNNKAHFVTTVSIHKDKLDEICFILKYAKNGEKLTSPEYTYCKDF